MSVCVLGRLREVAVWTGHCSTWGNGQQIRALSIRAHRHTHTNARTQPTDHAPPQHTRTHTHAYTHTHTHAHTHTHTHTHTHAHTRTHTRTHARTRTYAHELK